MDRRITLALAAALGSTLAFPLVARADQAILIHDAVFEVDPGEVVEHIDVLVLSRFGMPTVVFDGATGFADDETVVATISLSTHEIDGLGSVELLSSPTISGTTPADWTTGEVPGALTFQPAIELRYTAPSEAALACDEHPGERFTTHLGISATLVGSKGTMASFSADNFPGVVSFNTWCPIPGSDPRPPAPAPEAPTVTPPPTNTLPLQHRTGSRGEWADRLLFFALLSGAAASVVLTRQSRTHLDRR